MAEQLSDLARRLADQAEAVCRYYISNGRRHGRYWLVGDIDNTPGRSLYVRLTGAAGAEGAAGRWTDAATGQYGDLLDLIAAAGRGTPMRDAIREARRFLGEPTFATETTRPHRHPVRGPSEQARRLFAMGRPVRNTLAETYLRQRGITIVPDSASVRFHPRCWHGETHPGSDPQARNALPAMIAAVTDLAGAVTGAQRTWLDPSGSAKADLSTPRRALGHLLGHGVRFGRATDVLAAGEGIETVLSVQSVLPGLPIVAALSAAHLAALVLQPGLRRLYVVRDNDSAGLKATQRLTERARLHGIEVLTLAPRFGDFNDDLRQLDTETLLDDLRLQLAPDDVARFWSSSPSAGTVDHRRPVRTG